MLFQRILATTGAFLVLQGSLYCQRGELEIGYWRDHLPYSNANSVTKGNGVIYCGTEAALVEYDISSGEIKRYNTITGLSDIGIRQVNFNQASQTLVIAYKTGNVDLLRQGTIYNLTAIKDASIIADKTIYDIYFDGSLAYLSCGFGIVVIDLKKREVKDTYLLGNNSEPIKINDVYVHHPNNQILAASDFGIYTANLNTNLSDYSNWSKLSELPDSAYNHISFFAGKLLFSQTRIMPDSDLIYGFGNGVLEPLYVLERGHNNQIEVIGERLIVTKEYNIQAFNSMLDKIDIVYSYDGTISPNCSQTLYDRDRYYIADRQLGLVEYFYYGVFESLTPNGPNELNINEIDIKDGQLWGTIGLLDPSFRESFSPPLFNRYNNLTWTGLDYRSHPLLKNSYGYINIEIDPLDNNHAYASSWNRGVVEFQGNEIVASYDYESMISTGHSLTPLNGTESIRCGGLSFDDANNLWISCSETPYSLAVKTAAGEWFRYYLGAYVSDGTIVGDVLVARNGYKWIILSRETGTRVIVFDDNGTLDIVSDDRITSLGSGEGNGSIPGASIFCITEDRGGAIWLGTDEGPAVIYSPSNVFDSQLEAQQVFVQQDGLTQILLETELIKSIAVDGANRKWFGTENSGVYLMSSDGTTQINHFTADNSPLFSNDIKDIEVDDENGEVFFCTGEGVISYRGTATEGGTDFSEVQVFPNPVPRNYGGVIAIKGMAENANVKITDVNGVLIYETTANGGQAIWNGRNREGRKALNGVYLVFSSDQSGEYQNVTKLLYLNN